MTVDEALVKFGFVVDKSSLNSTQRTISALKSFAVKTLAGIGVGLSVKSLVSMAEQYTKINDSIKEFAKKAKDADTAQSQILDASKELNKSYQEMATQVGNLLKSGKASTVADAIKQIKKEAGETRKTVSGTIQSFRDDVGLFIADIYDTMDVGKRLSESMERVFNRIRGSMNRVRPVLERVVNFALKGVDKLVDWVERGIDFIERAVEALGGAETVLRLIGVAIGIIVGYELISKAATLVKILNPLTVTIGLLAMLIEDFYVFMQGGDSVLEDVFESLGISAEDARKNIKTMVEDLQKSVENIGKTISDHKEEIGQIIPMVIIGLTFITALLNPIPALIIIIFSTLVLIAGQWDKVKEAGGQALDWITEKAQALHDLLEPILEKIEAIGKAFNESWIGKKLEGYFQENLPDYRSMGDDIPESAKRARARALRENPNAGEVKPVDFSKTNEKMLSSVIDSTGGVLQEFAGQGETSGADFDEALASGIEANAEKPVGAIERLVEGIKKLIGFSVPEDGPLSDADQYMPDMMKLLAEGIDSNASIVESAITTVANIIKNGIKDALDPTTAYQWATDFMTGLADGIREGAAGLLEEVNAVAQGISDPLHFSRPETGPLADYESWMPDFLTGMANGVMNNAGVLLDALRGVASDMSSIIGASIADLGTLNAAMATTTNSVRQNVNITNNFSGDRAAQIQGANAMDKSAKSATAYMADALKFGR